MNRRGFFSGAAAAVFAAIVSVHIDLVAEPELDRDPDKGPTWNEVLERQITKVRAARAQAAKNGADVKRNNETIMIVMGDSWLPKR